MPTLGHSSRPLPQAACPNAKPPSLERNSAEGLVPAKMMLGSTDQWRGPRRGSVHGESSRSQYSPLSSLRYMPLSAPLYMIRASLEFAPPERARAFAIEAGGRVARCLHHRCCARCLVQGCLHRSWPVSSLPLSFCYDAGLMLTRTVTQGPLVDPFPDTAVQGRGHSPPSRSCLDQPICPSSHSLSPQETPSIQYRVQQLLGLLGGHGHRLVVDLLKGHRQPSLYPRGLQKMVWGFEAVSAHVYRKWPIKASQKCWDG